MTERLTDPRELQAHLSAAGYYRGAIDGVWGPRSRAAAQAAMIERAATAPDPALMTATAALLAPQEAVAAYTYEQRTGRLLTPDGKPMTIGYSGHGQGLNNPDMEHVVAVGPIPRGLWKMGAPYNSGKVGRLAIPLSPEGHGAHGRSAFLVHGDNTKGNRSASNGCIIAPHPIRQALISGLVRHIRVVRG
jgi:hypothetical protein